MVSVREVLDKRDAAIVFREVELSNKHLQVKIRGQVSLTWRGSKSEWTITEKLCGKNKFKKHTLPKLMFLWF